MAGREIIIANRHNACPLHSVRGYNLILRSESPTNVRVKMSQATQEYDLKQNLFTSSMTFPKDLVLVAVHSVTSMPLYMFRSSSSLSRVLISSPLYLR